MSTPRKPTNPAYVESSAVISEDGLFRYRLVRRWADGPIACFVMLNPSVADAEKPDPTMTRCRNFAQAWGYAGFVIVNLFAYRATKPADMRAFGLTRAIGPDNDRHILAAALEAAVTIVAWGANPTEGRAPTVLRMLRKAGIVPHHLGLTDKGQPRHPLMLKNEVTPKPMESAHV